MLLPPFQVRTSCNGWTSPTALTNMEGSARNGRTFSHAREREKTKKYGNKNEVGPDTVKPISNELGGRMGPEARCGELNATALKKVKLVVERTLIWAEADALNATTAHEVQTNVRRMLRGIEHERRW